MSEAILRYQQVLARRKQLYDTYVSTGAATPFLYPWDPLPVVYLCAALVIGPRLSPRNNRILNISTCIAIVGHSAYVCSQRRTIGLVSGYGIGLTSVWGTIMATVLLVIHRSLKDFARLEWTDGDKKTANGQASTHSQTTESHRDNEVRRRQVAGSATETSTNDRSETAQSSTEGKLVWQSVPQNSLYHRIDWALDLVTCFRGGNWNFRDPTLKPIQAPPLDDKTIELTRSVVTDQPDKSPKADSPTSKRIFQFNSLRNTVLLYLLIDIIKAVALTDPYFLGLTPMTTPSPWTFVHKISKITNIPLYVVSRISRLALTLPAVVGALCFIFSLSPLFFYTILPKLIDPKRITKSPLTAQWMYPSYFHPLFPTIADKGLGGLWGKSWHQVFRNGFSQPSIPILRYFNIDPKSQLGRSIQLFVAFGLSGTIHGIASYTTFSIHPSKPYMPFLFFMLQAIGVTIQTLAANFITKTLNITPPRIVRRITNSLFVLIWAYYTGPVLADDFARCGVWLFEPLPITFVRPLFMGGRFWMWETWGDWIGVWNGVEGRREWYDRGVAIL